MQICPVNINISVWFVSLCPLATLSIKGPTQPVLRYDWVVLDCLVSGPELNLSQVHFEFRRKVSVRNARLQDRDRIPQVRRVSDLNASSQWLALKDNIGFFSTKVHVLSCH